MTTREQIRTRARKLPVFDGVPDEDINRLLAGSTMRMLDIGEVLIVEGEEAQTAYLILDGVVEIVRSAGDGDVVVATRHAGELVGEMALLMESRRGATVRAQTPVSVIEITSDSFQSVLASRPETAISMLRTIWERLQSAEAHLVQHQKMAGLGTLAAGLAHELNNPASALIRSANQLSGVIDKWEEEASTLGSLSLSPDERETIDALRAKFGDVAPVSHVDPLGRADLEESLQIWLEAHDIDDPWRLAPLLVDADISLASLEQLASRVEPAHLAALLWWYGNGTLVYRLLQELSLSGRAISEIVTAVKAYTRLDQAPVQEIEIHDGINQALVILRHKLRGVQIARDFAENLPEIIAFAGELNQVWTNLIDNAADAMDGAGTLTIRTRRENGDIIVDIEDSGPGIPGADRDCVFNPFFTTKPPGEGTGLGLAISYNIVRKHGGDIRLDSEPGRTCFSVRIPVDTGIE